MKNSLTLAKKESDKQELKDKIKKLIDKTTKVFKKKKKKNGCIGSIAEIYDSIEPQLPKGTISQAWSISEIFRIILGK